MNEKEQEAMEMAIKFHETYERLAPQFGYETRSDTKAFDAESPNGKLMIAVCGEVLAGYQSASGRMREALERAKCPDCDGTGVLAEHSGYCDPDGGCDSSCPVPVECEWCWRRNNALAATPTADQPQNEKEKENADL